MNTSDLSNKSGSGVPAYEGWLLILWVKWVRFCKGYIGTGLMMRWRQDPGEGGGEGE